MLVYFSPQSRNIVTRFSQVLRVYPRLFFFLSQSLVHRQESLRVLALCLVHGRQLVAERRYLGFERIHVRYTYRIAGGGNRR
jgi:hypothetical protein